MIEQDDGAAVSLLQATADDLAAVLGALPDPVFVFKAVRDQDGTVVELVHAFVNEAAARLYGRPAEEILGRGQLELYPSVREQGLWDAYLGVLESGTPVTVDVPWFQEDGIEGSFRVTASRFRDGLVVSPVDVTEQRRVEKALAEASHRYQMVAENASDFVVETSPDGVITWVSPSVTAVLGWQPEELVGHSGLDFAHPDEAATLQDPGARAATGLEATAEIRLRCADGSFRWVSRRWSVVTDDSGALVARVAGMRDVQAEVDARAALRESETRYQLLAENATDVVTLTDRDRRVLWLSPSVTRTLGWTPEELVGTRLSDLVHPDDREVTATARDELYAGRDVTPPDSGFVMRIRGKSGDYRWISLTATPVKSESGTFEGVVGGWRYVDELVRAQQAIQAERATLRATLDSLLDPHVLLEAVRDESGQIVDFVYADANPAACAYNGLEYQDLVGARLLEVLPGHAGAGLLDEYRHVVESGEPLVLDDVVYSQELLGGVERHYDVRAAPVGDGLSYTWRDVTDRHQFAQRLGESEEQYRLLAENASDVIMRLSPDRSFEWVSGSVAGVLGWEMPDLLGRALDEFVHPEDLAMFRLAADGVSPESPMSLEFRFRSSDGTYRWVACRTRLKVDEGGAPVTVVGGLVDITDRKAAEAHELERLKELEQFQRLTVGRELKMIELKREIDYLRNLSATGSPAAEDPEPGLERPEGVVS